MKHSGRILDKINNLLDANYEVEKIYSEIFKTVSNESIKKFFKERQIKRHEFSRELITEIDKHDIIPKSVSSLNNYYNKKQSKGKDIEILNSGNSLLFEVFRLKNESLDTYNELLTEMSLPLSICKALIKQRDDIQATIQILARDEVFV